MKMALDYQLFIAAMGGYVRTIKTKDEALAFIRAIKTRTVKQNYILILQQQIAALDAQKAELQATITAASSIAD
jgi:hypothetical protein